MTMSDTSSPVREPALTMISASREVLIRQSPDRINLVDWLTNLTDREYQACSVSHRAAGIFYEDGRLGSINVESIGGHLLVQHYLAEESSAHHLVMLSKKSRAYLMHVLPVSIEVIWTLNVQRAHDGNTLFRCTVETRMPVLLGAVAKLGLLPLFIRRHVNEEAALFARDIERKASRGELIARNAPT